MVSLLLVDWEAIIHCLEVHPVFLVLVGKSPVPINTLDKVIDMPKAHHFCCFLGTPKKFLGPIYMFPRESFNKYIGYGYATPTNLVSSLPLPRSFQAQFTCSQELLSTNTLDIDLSSPPTLRFLLWLPRISQAQFTCSLKRSFQQILWIHTCQARQPCGSFCGSQEVPKLNLHALKRSFQQILWI